MIQNIYSEIKVNFLEYKRQKSQKITIKMERSKNQWLINFEKPDFDTFYKVFLKNHQIKNQKKSIIKMDINNKLKFFIFPIFGILECKIFRIFKKFGM